MFTFMLGCFIAKAMADIINAVTPDTIKTPFATIKVDPHDELIEFLVKDNFINDEDLMTQLLDEED